MGNLHATTINAMLNQFEQNLEVKSSLQKYLTRTKIDDSFVKTAQFFHDNNAQDLLFSLCLRRLTMSYELETLKDEYNQIAKKSHYKS